MKNIRGKTWLLVGLVVLLVLLIAVPAFAAGKETPAKNLKRITLVDYAPGVVLFDKPSWSGKPTPSPIDNSVYQLLPWQWASSSSPIQLTLDQTGAPSGTDAKIQAALNTWDAATGVSLFDPLATWADSGPPSWTTSDGVNSVSFQFLLGYPQALALTNLTIDGSTIVETDVVFNTKYTWAIDTDGVGTTYTLAKRQYDVQNVGTHELGHVVGLDDLYLSSYRELTMYGSAAATETKKDSLEAGDIIGTQILWP